MLLRNLSVWGYAHTANSWKGERSKLQREEGKEERKMTKKKRNGVVQ